MKEQHKKESPILSLLGMGGGGTGNALGGGVAPVGTLTMYLWGAGGGDRNNAEEPGNGGSGGFMQASGATFAESDTLYVYVGSPGITQADGGPNSLPSIFGGAPTSLAGTYSGGGGGASYVTLNGEKTSGSGSGTIIAVAGAGGGNGYSGGGGGGYPTGGTGGGYDGATGGTGGTQSAGGTGGNNDHGGSAPQGAFLLGGNGGPGSTTTGGGGGGGYYGGGGGGGANTNSGGDGGGGSSYVNPTYVTADAHATGDSDSNLSGPSPLVAEHINPKWHNRGGGEDFASTTGGGGTTNAGRRYSGGCEAGGRGRVVLTNGIWKRTFNFNGTVQSIPANYSPAGLDFTMDASCDRDGPYDNGFGWGHGPGFGACTASHASSNSVTLTFTFTSGSGSGDRDFTSFEVWTHALNGKTQLTGQFNSDSPFNFPTHTPTSGTPSGNLAPHLPSGDISTFKITNPGGSGNTHLFVHEMRINGATVDFGRNYI